MNCFEVDLLRVSVTLSFMWLSGVLPHECVSLSALAPVLESMLFPVLAVSGTTASLGMEVGVPASVMTNREMIWVK